MRSRNGLLLITLVMMALRLSAQGDQPLTKADRVFEDLPTVSEVVPDDGKQTPRPDYSREALLSTFWTDPEWDEDIPRAPDTFNPLQFTILGQTFRFMPFFASTATSSSSAIPFGFVDPFAGAPVSAAHTPKTFRDRFREWKMKRALERGEW